MLEIVRRFAQEGYQIDPQALELISSYSGPKNELIVRVLGSLDGSVAVIDPSHVSKHVSVLPERSTLSEKSKGPISWRGQSIKRGSRRRSLKSISTAM